jgi:hypothetical protein
MYAVVELTADYLCGMVSSSELPNLLQQSANEHLPEEWLASGTLEGTVKPAVLRWVRAVCHRVGQAGVLREGLRMRTTNLHDVVHRWSAKEVLFSASAKARNETREGQLTPRGAQRENSGADTAEKRPGRSCS